MEAETSTIIGMRWDDFRPWFEEHWEQGQHVALIGPTGEGKTNLACSFLPLREHVLALDPKGGDSTLARLKTKCGFRQQSSWPLNRKQWERIEKGEPLRLVVGRKLNVMEDMTANALLLKRVIHDVFAHRGWTVYIDELQMASDPRYMRLAPGIELNLIAGRDRGISIVTSYQRPSNVPRAASEMASWLIVYYTRDKDVVGRLAEMAGRDVSEVRGWIRALDPYCVLVISNNPRQPVIVTKAPRF